MIDKISSSMHMTIGTHAMPQVRALCLMGPGFATASRDRTGKVWVESSTHAFQDTMTLVTFHHDEQA
jgi:hypothetical protein